MEDQQRLNQTLDAKYDIIDELEINGVSHVDNPDIYYQLLNYSFPTGINQLVIDLENVKSENMKEYTDLLIQSSVHIYGSIKVRHLQLSLEDFTKLVSAFKH